ncbi:UDP-glucosyltransferase 2-like [Cylas formicarius]|uniref:UDP-glucosyltransferase 2-like n=1 Tax=Cylas formicarius TaxID=197179 RepID=UPI002958CB25|nr:UDP-glucosyltransferase 2-like [Cylas formicarius]
MKTYVFLMLTYVATTTEGANILITFEAPRRSHQIWISNVVEQLLERKHNVTMAIPFPDTLARIKAKVRESIDEVTAEHENYTSIALEGIITYHKHFDQRQLIHSGLVGSLKTSHRYNYDICDRVYRSKGFQRLWSYPDSFKFDLIIVDVSLGQCLYPLIKKFGGAQVVGFSPSSLNPYLSSVFGSDDQSAYIPSRHLRDVDLRFFFDRLLNYLTNKFEYVFKQNWELKSIENLAEKHLQEEFNFEELQRSVSLLLVNYNPLLNRAQLLPPNIVPVAGLHLKRPEELPSVLAMILNKAFLGVVFVSLGTDIQPEILCHADTKTIANALGRLVQKTVIWKNRTINTDLPENIVVHAWMPQNELLAHANTKLLITTGGLLSIQEAIVHGIPVIGLPITEDHRENMKIITENKLGLQLDVTNLTEDLIYDSVTTVLNNPVFKDNMDTFSLKFKAQLENPVVKAVRWIEYLLRYNDTSFLSPSTRYVSSFSAKSFDVELFIFVVLLFAIFSIARACLSCLKLIYRYRNRTQVKVKSQ